MSKNVRGPHVVFDNYSVIFNNQHEVSVSKASKQGWDICQYLKWSKMILKAERVKKFKRTTCDIVNYAVIFYN